MSRVIVIEFVTLDGVVEDPDGSGGTPGGGWAFRHGPEAVAGDKFRLGSRLENGVLLLGRATWQLFAKIWPGRSNAFSTTMNRVPKLVASRSQISVDAWANSSLLEDGLVPEVQGRDRDVIVAGSTSVVRTLAEHDLIDEYRLLVFPTVLGTGQRLFAGPGAPTDLRLTSVEQSGAAALMCYERADAPRGPGDR
jgi:dihydrofolate reductase